MQSIMTVKMGKCVLFSAAIATVVACGPTKPVASRNSAQSSATNGKGESNAEVAKNSAPAAAPVGAAATNKPAELATASAPADAAKAGAANPIDSSSVQAVATGVVDRLVALVSTPQGLTIVKEILAVPEIQKAIQNAGLGSLAANPESTIQLLKNPIVISALTNLVIQAVSGKESDSLSPSALAVLLGSSMNAMALPTPQPAVKAQGKPAQAP